MEKLKTAVTEKIESRRHQLSELSLKIHDNPELGFQEVKAADWLTEYLEENGFSIERGICGIATAFLTRSADNLNAATKLVDGLFSSHSGAGGASAYYIMAAAMADSG